jgi:hypothetical protein
MRLRSGSEWAPALRVNGSWQGSRPAGAFILLVNDRNPAPATGSISV